MYTYLCIHVYIYIFEYFGSSPSSIQTWLKRTTDLFKKKNIYIYKRIIRNSVHNYVNYPEEKLELVIYNNCFTTSNLICKNNQITIKQHHFEKHNQPLTRQILVSNTNKKKHTEKDNYRLHIYECLYPVGT